MKTLFLNFILLLSLSVLANQEGITQADSAYQAHNYELAINLYTQALASNEKSAPLYYNLGNAYFKNNELGKAIWAYQKAKKIDPQQKDISYNLNYVSNLTKDKIEQNETGISKWVAKVFFGRSINFWSILSIVFIVLTCLCFYIFKITIPKNRKGVFLIASFISGFLFISSITLALTHKGHITNISHGIIVDPVVKIRTAPSIEDGIAFELHEGAKFKYKETKGDWYRIVVGKNEGWILKEKALLY